MNSFLNLKNTNDIYNKIDKHLIENCKSEKIAEKYSRNEKLGEGTYAVVYKATHLASSTLVAIKKIKFGQFKDGMDMSAIREIKFLQELSHENIVKLYDVFSEKGNINLVLEFLESDLEILVKDKNILFMPSDIKSWILMTIRGLEHCHRSFILHRDLKPNNLLISKDGVLKLADFGLARFYGDPLGTLTSQVVTRWYRAPELLYGAKEYGAGVDIWAAGCIFAELMLRAPYLPGESDMDQLNTIFRALGTPTEQDWPGMTKLPDYVEYKKHPRTAFRQIFTAASDDALDLLQRMLEYDPNKRISAKDALKHAYFSASPFPTSPKDLPKKTPSVESKKRQRLLDNDGDNDD